MFVPTSIHTQNFIETNPFTNFSTNIRDIENNISVRMFQDKSVEVRNKSLAIVRYSHVTTSNNSIWNHINLTTNALY